MIGLIPLTPSEISKRYKDRHPERYRAIHRKADKKKYDRLKLDPIWMEKEKARNRERMRKKRLNPEFLAAERKKGVAHKNLMWKTSKEFRDRCRDNRRKNYNRNPEFRKSIQRANNRWNCSPKGLHSRARRSSMERDGRSTLTLEQWNMILAIQGNMCGKCHKQFSESNKPHRDHIIPVVLGGALTFDNTQALCKSCNSSKGPRPGVYRKDLIDIQ